MLSQLLQTVAVCHINHSNEHYQQENTHGEKVLRTFAQGWTWREYPSTTACVSQLMTQTAGEVTVRLLRHQGISIHSQLCHCYGIFGNVTKSLSLVISLMRAPNRLVKCLLWPDIWAEINISHFFYHNLLNFLFKLIQISTHLLLSNFTYVTITVLHGCCDICKIWEQSWC